MTRLLPLAFLIIVLLVHAGLIAWAITAMRTQPDTPAEPLSIAVQLLPTQEKAAPETPPPAPLPPAPPAPVPPPPPPPVIAAPEPLSVPTPPEPKSAEPKPVPMPKPKAAAKPRPSRKPAAPETTAPEAAPAPLPPIPSPAAPPTVATAAPVAPPAPPTKTGVYIPAEYAATNRKPVYPPMAVRYGEQGTVTLRVFVGADGTAGQVEIRSSSGSPLLDESARSAVQGWRFRPATSDGKPVADWFLIPIPFKLQN